MRAVPRCKALLKFRLNRGSQRQVHKACSELELVLAQYMNRERQGTPAIAVLASAQVKGGRAGSSSPYELER